MTTATLAAGNRTMATEVRPQAQPGRAGRPAHGGAWVLGCSRRRHRRRRHRAWPGASTRRGDSGRRGRLSKVRWRSSPAWTRRRLSRHQGSSVGLLRVDGPGEDGGSVSVTPTVYSQGAGPGSRPGSQPATADILEVVCGRLGCAGGPARSSRPAACGGFGPWEGLALDRLGERLGVAAALALGDVGGALGTSPPASLCEDAGLGLLALARTGSGRSASVAAASLTLQRRLTTAELACSAPLPAGP